MMTRPCPAEEKQSHGTGKRRWTDKMKCKIVDAVAPRPRRKVPSDVDVEMKQRLQREFAEHQARRRRSAPLPSDGGPNGGGDGAATEAVANLDARPKKGILKARSKFASAPEPVEESATPALVELLFPTGVLARPPKSSGPENVPSLLMTVIAAAEKRQQGGAGRPDGDGATETKAVANLDARPKKGILKARSKFASAPPTLVELLFPVGVLATPPKSFRSSGPEHTTAFLMSVEKSGQGGPGSSSSTRRVDRELVEQWSNAKENSLRRGRYLRDFAPFQKDDDDENVTLAPEPDHSDSEETLPVETDHSEEVNTGLPFDSPTSEAEFVEAIFSRHERKDDFINRYAFERSRDPFMRQQSLQAGESCAGGLPESRRIRNVVTPPSSASDRSESLRTRNVVTPASSAGNRPESRRTRKVTFRDC